MTQRTNILSKKRSGKIEPLETLIEELQVIGLTKNEARIYIELLRLSELTPASTIVKLTEIADSKIYYIMDSLHRKGLIILQQGTPKKYLVIHPVETLKNFRIKFEQEYQNKLTLVDHLVERLIPFYKTREDPPKIANVLKGKNNILNHARKLLEEATSDVILMIPKMEIFYFFENMITSIQQQGIKVLLGLYYKIISKERIIFKSQAIVCECFFLIVDNRVLLTISGMEIDHWNAILTSEKSLIEVSRGYFSSPYCVYDGARVGQ